MGYVDKNFGIQLNARLHPVADFTVLSFFSLSSLRWCWPTVLSPLAVLGSSYSAKLSSWVGAGCQEREEGAAMPQRMAVRGSTFRQRCLSLALSETVFKTVMQRLWDTNAQGKLDIETDSIEVFYFQHLFMLGKIAVMSSQPKTQLGRVKMMKNRKEGTLAGNDMENMTKYIDTTIVPIQIFVMKHFYSHYK